jgi:hypothetical protein
MNRCCLSYHSVLLACWLGVLPQHLWAVTQADVAKGTIISEKELGPTTHTVLIVDADDTVRELEEDVSQPQTRPVLTANLGTRVTASGTISLSSVVPKDKVPTLAKRVTLTDGTIIHVIIAWGYSRWPDVLSPRCSLFVFRQDHGDTKLLISEELGAEFDQLVVEDLNQDGKTEILVATRENAITSMDIWQIQPEKDVRKIQRIDGYRVHTQGDRFVGKEEGIIAEHKIVCSVPAAVCLRVDDYVWSPKQQRFAKR